MDDTQRRQDTQRYWDDQAGSFDQEPDHGLHHPVVLEAWTRLLHTWLPSSPVSVLDIGCGTGSLSVVMARMNHQVIGIDFSEAMIARAQSKASKADQQISFKLMDAFDPQLSQASFDVIVCRHLLWAMPSVDLALRRWSRLLSDGGRLILVEGYWNNQGGLHAQQVVDALPSTLTMVAVENLSTNAALWGSAVDDERYAVIADRKL